MFKRIGWIWVEELPGRRKWADIAPIFPSRAAAREWKIDNCNWARHLKLRQVVQYVR